MTTLASGGDLPVGIFTGPSGTGMPAVPYSSALNIPGPTGNGFPLINRAGPVANLVSPDIVYITGFLDGDAAGFARGTIVNHDSSDEQYEQGHSDGFLLGLAAASRTNTAATRTGPIGFADGYGFGSTLEDDYSNGYDDGRAFSASTGPTTLPPDPPPVILIPPTSRRSLQRGIMTVTPRFKWPIPTRNVDDWYEPFVSLQISIDTTTFANTEDRNAICMGGGTFTYAQLSGLISWSATIEILSANTGFVRTIAAGSLVLNEGEMFVLELPRFPSENLEVAPVAVSNLSVLGNINDTFVLAVRRNNIVYFRNGKNMQDGDSFKVLATTGP